MPKIVAAESHLFELPLPEKMGDAKHGLHEYFELPIIRLTTDNGMEGVGYTYTGGVGGRAVLAHLKHDLTPMLLGMETQDIQGLFEAMYWKTHYVGRGGAAGFAISAVDIALWDLKGKSEGRSLLQLAGGNSKTTRAYAGGIDLNFSTEKLLSNVQGYLDRGFEAVKIKVGRPDLAEDTARVAAIRTLIGPDRTLMVDANYGFSRNEAKAASDAFAPYDVLWFEEPIDPEDIEGYAWLAEKTSIPLAQGENLHSANEFRQVIKNANVTYIQPDASNCGGISGWLEVAVMAKKAGLTVCSHGMQELHVSLMSSQAHAGWMEVHSFPIEAYTKRQIHLENGLAVAPDEPGIGVEFIWEKLAPFEIN
jgi:L-alanine-DL-glutamate epimerase-like enolase superfamily enzyme